MFKIKAIQNFLCKLQTNFDKVQNFKYNYIFNTLRRVC